MGNVINSVSYSPLKQIEEIEYTNGTVTTNAYDPLQAYRLTDKQTVLNDFSLQDLQYVYDHAGNILTLIDSSETQTAKTVNYFYDELYRLIGASAINTANNEDYV